MRTMKKNIYSRFFALLVALPLVACVSTQKTPEPPLWDTQGIQRIAVMPFDVIGQSELEREAAKGLYTTAKASFPSDRFIIVDTANQADAVFRGELIDYVRHRYAEDYEKIVIISYSLTRTSDGSFVGENTIYYKGSYNEPIELLQRHLSRELGIKYGWLYDDGEYIPASYSNY